jgi:hypothetical protein
VIEPDDETLDMGPDNKREGKRIRVAIGGLTVPDAGRNDDDVQAFIREGLFFADGTSGELRAWILDSCRLHARQRQIIATDECKEAEARYWLLIERYVRQRGLLTARKRTTTEPGQLSLTAALTNAMHRGVPKGKEREPKVYRPKHEPNPEEKQAIGDLVESGHGVGVKHVLPPGLAELFTTEEVHEISKARLRAERQRKRKAASGENTDGE